jgi:hypothetical protein
MQHDSAGASSPGAASLEDASGHDTAPMLAQVWGDTVDIRHLGASIAIGVAASMSAFLLGKSLLASWVRDPELAHACSMLAGLGGCLVAGLICALAFKPKRLVAEQAIDEAARAEVLRMLSAESGGLGSLADLSPDARAELAELGILDMFAHAEQSNPQQDSPARATGARGAQTGAC